MIDSILIAICSLVFVVGVTIKINQLEGEIDKLRYIIGLLIKSELAKVEKEIEDAESNG